VIVNLSVEDNPAVAVFRQDGLIAVIQIDDFQSCRAQREEVRMKYALLVGSAMNEGRGRLPDAFRWRAPVLSCKPGNSAQMLAFLACSRLRIGRL
jgi:hypothetical protein